MRVEYATKESPLVCWFHQKSKGYDLERPLSVCSSWCSQKKLLWIGSLLQSWNGWYSAHSCCFLVSIAHPLANSASKWIFQWSSLQMLAMALGAYSLGSQHGEHFRGIHKWFLVIPIEFPYLACWQEDWDSRRARPFVALCFTSLKQVFSPIRLLLWVGRFSWHGHGPFCQKQHNEPKSRIIDLIIVVYHERMD